MSAKLHAPAQYDHAENPTGATGQPPEHLRLGTRPPSHIGVRCQSRCSGTAKTLQRRVCHISIQHYDSASQLAALTM
eukprot:1177387-Prorocentrum_minimum.AAC.6